MFLAAIVIMLPLEWLLRGAFGVPRPLSIWLPGSAWLAVAFAVITLLDRRYAKRRLAGSREPGTPPESNARPEPK
jgi:hypothetical protein